MEFEKSENGSVDREDNVLYYSGRMKKRMLFIPVALTFGGIFFLYHMNNTIEIFGPA